jgi:hypothetical protein
MKSWSGSSGRRGISRKTTEEVRPWTGNSKSIRLKNTLYKSSMGITAPKSIATKAIVGNKRIDIKKTTSRQ